MQTTAKEGLNPRSNLNSEITTGKGIHFSRLKIIESIINGYDGKLPFSKYLKIYYSAHKNFGSRDRRLYSAFSFGFFRIGKALSDFAFTERLAVSAYLVQHSPNEFLDFLVNEFLSPKLAGVVPDVTNPVETKVKFLEERLSFNPEDIFPFDVELSGELTRREYALSMLSQPAVWIRVNPKFTEQLLSELDKSNIKFEQSKEFDNAISFFPETDLLNLQVFQKGGFEIQDLSSQIAGSLIPVKEDEAWWDCCAGAGGKSLQLLDRVPGIKIFATDKRQTILDNFKERMKRQGKRGVSMMEIDLENKVPPGKISGQFDGIIADLPCTGSGTWARNPESLVYFNPETIEKFVKRQKSILSNIIGYLKDGGYLAYVTCSVFRQENEEILEYLAGEHQLHIEQQVLVNGTSEKADSMFIGILKRKM